MTNFWRVLALGAAAATLLPQVSAGAGGPADRADKAVFAVVDGVTIGVDEFEGTLSAAIQQKYYHRRPPEDQLAALREEVTDRVVNQVLLLNEAKRRSLQPDDEKVRAQVAQYESRYRDRPQWQESRAEVLPALMLAVQNQNVIAQLEAATRIVAPPAEEAYRRYYAAHPEPFTEPERLRLSIITLKVDPSSPGAEWQQAFERAQEILEQIRSGADFGDLARLHSGDPSAHDGGDMGYRHRGMLPPGVEEEIEKMTVGALSAPMRLLEGVAIIKLTERRPARLRQYEDVRGAVSELWAREQAESQWRELLARLRANAEIRINRDLVAGPVAGGISGGGKPAH
jgi:hypothetical protein